VVIIIMIMQDADRSIDDITRTSDASVAAP
jgi:hypothetical protein